MSSNDDVMLPPILAREFASFDAAADRITQMPAGSAMTTVRRTRPLTRTTSDGQASRHQAEQPPPVAAASSYSEYTEAVHSCRAASAYKKSILHPSYECLRQIQRLNLHDGKPPDLPPPPAHTPHSPGLPESHTQMPSRSSRSRRSTAPNPVRVQPVMGRGDVAALRKVRPLAPAQSPEGLPCGHAHAHARVFWGCAQHAGWA